MIIKRLQVVNLRAFEQAEFEFKPGMNLLVGVNGVGKSTVLDSIRICLSKIIPDITAFRSRKESFDKEDIRIKSKFMTVNCTFEFQDKEFTFIVHKNLESNIPRESNDPREQVLETPDKESYNPPLPNSFHNLKKASSNPLGLFFSTQRSLVPTRSSLVYAIASNKRAAGGQASGYADALVSRKLQLAEIAYWMLAQEKLGDERPLGLKHLSSLQKAAEHFMPECKNLRTDRSPKSWLSNDAPDLFMANSVTKSQKPRLIVDKAGTTLDLRQLSDGERGMFALVLDLAKRLSQANPQLDDPVRDGSAIVLIDEIDLHLHPKWQRTIVKKLTETFPNCQFIATTHSPQIIASVEPEQVSLLTNSGVIPPERTRGMDSNWILRHLMEADDRPAESSSAISNVESLIIEGNFSEARAEIMKYRKNGLDLPEWSVLEARMARLEVLAE